MLHFDACCVFGSRCSTLIPSWQVDHPLELEAASPAPWVVSLCGGPNAKSVRCVDRLDHWTYPQNNFSDFLLGKPHQAKSEAIPMLFIVKKLFQRSMKIHEFHEVETTDGLCFWFCTQWFLHLFKDRCELCETFISELYQALDSIFGGSWLVHMFSTLCAGSWM